MRPAVTRAAALLGTVVVWATVVAANARLEFMNPVLLPAPAEVAAVLGDMVADGSLGQHVVTSGVRIVQGFGTAAVLALGLGLLAGVSAPVRLAVEPIIEFVRPIPPLAFLPMFLVWFGLGEASKVAFIGYTTFFPMFVAIASSVLRVDLVLLRAAASLGASRADLLWRVVVPSAFPGIIVALRLGFGLALFVIVGAEFMGADAGLGHLIMEGRTFFNPAQIVMGALVLGLLGSVVNAVLLAAERRVFRWRDASATS
jgi:ABC-type nitrate/sulfonate/bicarbonate transport system permease component